MRRSLRVEQAVESWWKDKKKKGKGKGQDKEDRKGNVNGGKDECKEKGWRS